MADGGMAVSLGVAAPLVALYPMLPRENTIKNLTETEATAMFERMRWPAGICCPRCKTPEPYNLNRADRPGYYGCRDCSYHFTITSGTPFHSRKATFKTILMSISIVQHNVGDVVIRRIAKEMKLNYKTAYVLIGKAQELLFAGMEHRSLYTGYMNKRGARLNIEFPRARVASLLNRQTCTECGVEKSADQFSGRCGLGGEWGLRCAVCKTCLSSQESVKQKRRWANHFAEEAATPIIQRTAPQILEAARGKPEWWWTRSRWSPQEKHDLAVLARANLPLQTASEVLHRAPTSVAWYARDLVGIGDLPKEWRAIVTPKRLTIPAVPRLLVYPYMPKLPRASDIDGTLVSEVAALVSKSYPDWMRADIGQTVLLAIFEGFTTLAELKANPGELRSFIKKYRRQQDSLPGIGGSMPSSRNSLDAPLWDDDDRNPYETSLPAGVMEHLEW
jgi:transposase-like protein